MTRPRRALPCFALLAVLLAAPAHAAPPFSGTIFLDPDIITPADPTAFSSLIPTGRGFRWMYDRRVPGWVLLEPYLFEASYDDGRMIEIQVNPEFGSESDALVPAASYAPVIGRLPAALRRDVATVWVHRGDEVFGGGNDIILIHTDRAAQYEASGILEEALVHEGTHTSIDADHASAPGWLAAQAADGEFISTYARDYPNQEDLAESYLTYLAVRYRADRLSTSLADTIVGTIPNRIAYFDALDLDLYPFLPCGDGTLQAGEECDDGNHLNGDCCSASCHHEPASSSCDSDADRCTLEQCDGAGTCASIGTVTCQSSVPPCEGGETCNPGTGACEALPDAPASTSCADDADDCTADRCDGAGSCVHPLMDVDGDLVCDAQDACTNAGGRDFLPAQPSPRLIVTKVNGDTTPGNDGLRLSAAFQLPEPTSFAALAPLARGARVVVRGHAGSVKLDQVLPPTAFAGKGTRGWKSDARGKSWQYLDQSTAPLSGIISLKILDRGDASSGRVRVTLTARNGAYDVGAGDRPLEVVLALGDASDALAGLCGESAFTSERCTFNRAGTTMTCK